MIEVTVTAYIQDPPNGMTEIEIAEFIRDAASTHASQRSGEQERALGILGDYPVAVVIRP